MARVCTPPSLSAPVCMPTAKFPLIHGPPESPGRDLTVLESKPFSARRSLSKSGGKEFGPAMTQVPTESTVPHDQPRLRPDRHTG